MSESRLPTEDEVLRYFDELSNWGRWGPDDELGTLNLITPDKRRAALAAVRHGITVGCARPIVVEPPIADVPYPPLHLMIRSGESAGAPSATDFLGLAPHGLTVSHIDTLGHVFWKGQIYNGRPASRITTVEGATVCSVETMKDGIVTRGILLDIARLKGRPYLDPGEPIMPADLEAAEQAAGVRLGVGDALCLRTGWPRRRAELGLPPVARHRPGLQAATLPWLHARGVALVAADTAHDVIPSGYSQVDIPIHQVGIVAMGLCLLDACQFEDLAEQCDHLSQWEFLLCIAPIRFRYATGSPVTPVAVL